MFICMEYVTQKMFTTFLSFCLFVLFFSPELSQRQLVESDGLGLIVHTMTGQQDEEFTKAATYLLHTCVRVGKKWNSSLL